MTCKIKGCSQIVYRVNLCRSHYNAWLDTGELPGETKPGRGHREAVERWTPSNTPRGYKAELLRLAEDVVEHAKKWQCFDGGLAYAIEAYEEAKNGCERQ